MNKIFSHKKLVAAGFVFAALFSLFALSPVSAHEAVKGGDTEVEVGWVDEPPVVGQRNAIVLIVAGGKDAPDISGLKVNLSYGPDSQDLVLQPMGEDTPGQYIAPIIPTIAGQYTVTLSGTLGGQAVGNVEVQPEEVAAASTLQFPPEAQGGAGSTSPTMAGGGLSILAPWLSLAALIIGIIAILISLLAMRKRA